MRATFIWGMGGVGKSHLAVRSAVEAGDSTLLMTMDPSLRVLDLLHITEKNKVNEVELDGQKFTVKTVDEIKLFHELSQKSPANPTVKLFFDRMILGLQEFRDYLTLIQVADEIRSAEYKCIVLDTPPFQEALGLHRSINNLQSFFDQSLVQFALKSTSLPWMQLSFKKVFEATRFFVGKNASQQVFQFVSWLASHTERFKVSAQFLDKLLSSPETTHRFIVTPETPPSFLASIKKAFETTSRVEFVLNRSVSHFSIPETKDAFLDEMAHLRKKETELTRQIKKEFPKSKVELLPMMLMGEDTLEEMTGFTRVQTSSI